MQRVTENKNSIWLASPQPFVLNYNSSGKITSSLASQPNCTIMVTLIRQLIRARFCVNLHYGFIRHKKRPLRNRVEAQMVCYIGTVYLLSPQLRGSKACNSRHTRPKKKGLIVCSPQAWAPTVIKVGHQPKLFCLVLYCVRKC